jgi:hypothetical protein
LYKNLSDCDMCEVSRYKVSMRKDLVGDILIYGPWNTLSCRLSNQVRHHSNHLSSQLCTGFMLDRLWYLCLLVNGLLVILSYRKLSRILRRISALSKFKNPLFLFFFLFLLHMWCDTDLWRGCISYLQFLKTKRVHFFLSILLKDCSHLLNCKNSGSTWLVWDVLMRESVNTPRSWTMCCLTMGGSLQRRLPARSTHYLHNCTHSNSIQQIVLTLLSLH